MNSIKDILNMVYTEAMEIEQEQLIRDNPSDTSLEKYDIGLIRDPKTGNLRWSK